MVEVEDKKTKQQQFLGFKCNPTRVIQLFLIKLGRGNWSWCTLDYGDIRSPMEFWANPTPFVCREHYSTSKTDWVTAIELWVFPNKRVLGLSFRQLMGTLYRLCYNCNLFDTKYRQIDRDVFRGLFVKSGILVILIFLVYLKMGVLIYFLVGTLTI